MMAMAPAGCGAVLAMPALAAAPGFSGAARET